jgi:hypothetical protein
MRQKRKERDSQLKEQARAASKKRKQQAESTTAEGVSLANQTLDAEADDASANPSKTPKLDRANLPAFLPSSFFEDDENEDGDMDIDALPSTTRKAKKTKFTDLLEEKGPKDVVRGSTTYTIATSSPHAALLTPKAVGSAKVTKEAWLQGRNGRDIGSSGGERRKEGTSFLVNKEKSKARRRR